MDSFAADSRGDPDAHSGRRDVRVCVVPVGRERNPASRIPAVAGVGDGHRSLRLATQRWPAIAYRFSSYRIDEAGIEIRHGVYWRTLTNVPRSRVQHTDVSQGPFERRYGLGTLVIYTAGTAHSKVNLSGLDFDVARRIRAHLLPDDQSDAV